MHVHVSVHAYAGYRQYDSLNSTTGFRANCTIGCALIFVQAYSDKGFSTCAFCCS